MKFLRQILSHSFKGPGKRPSPEMLAQEKARILNDPAFHILAQANASFRRQLAHRRSCMEGYQQKIYLVENGKGKNTLSGIPKALT